MENQEGTFLVIFPVLRKRKRKDAVQASMAKRSSNYDSVRISLNFIADEHIKSFLKLSFVKNDTHFFELSNWKAKVAYKIVKCN